MGWPEVAVFENFTEQPLNFSFWSVFLITKSRELLSRTRFLRTGINKLQSETQRGLRCQSSDTNTLYSDNIPSCEKYTICTWYLFYPKWEVTWGIFGIFAWKLYFARLVCRIWWHWAVMLQPPASPAPTVANHNASICFVSSEQL